jgi:hypothetical protein
MSKVNLDGYIAEIHKMVRQYREWRTANPKTAILVSFRVQNRVMVAGTIQDAIKNGFLVIDYNGKRMLKELGWLDDRHDAPSFNMVKMAIEFGNDPSTPKNYGAGSDHQARLPATAGPSPLSLFRR